MCEINGNGYDSLMSATGPINDGVERYWSDSTEYHDTVSINLNDRAEWVSDRLVGNFHGHHGVALSVHESDPPHGDWQQSHIGRRDHMIPISSKYSPALNGTKAAESKSSCEFNQAFLDAIATMHTGLYPRNPEKPYPSTPDLSRTKPKKTEVEGQGGHQTNAKAQQFFESNESWGVNN